MRILVFSNPKAASLLPYFCIKTDMMGLPKLIPKLFKLASAKSRSNLFWRSISHELSGFCPDFETLDRAPMLFRSIFLILNFTPPNEKNINRLLSKDRVSPGIQKW